MKLRAYCEVDTNKATHVKRMVEFVLDEKGKCDNCLVFDPGNEIYHINEYLSPMLRNTEAIDKDKNEIFESDILELEAFVQVNGHPVDPEGEEFHYTYTGEVKYTASLGFHIKVICQYDEILGEFVTPTRIKMITQSRCKKIGNVYENPELLEKLKKSK